MIFLPLLTMAGVDLGRGTVADAPIVDAMNVGWVRINLVHEPGHNLDFYFYDQIIDAYVARGIEVYLLINDEAVNSSAPLGSDAWIGAYVATAANIVGHYKERVRFYELVNEPNDFAGGSSARFTPAQFAKILRDTRAIVKGTNPDRCQDVQLVSGPLFSFDGNSGADYLQQTFAAAGSVPVDAIGYHMYVAQGTGSTTADVRTQMLANLSAIGAVSDKPIWVSEYGWEASAVGETLQAERLTAGYNAMTEYGNVAGAFYFNMHDFPGATYGVYGRPAATALSAIGNKPLWAQTLEVAVPDLVATDAHVDVVVRMKNRGTETWTRDAYRLAAGAGCPDTSFVNNCAWEVTDGYVNSPTDARVFLSAPVAPGDTAEFHLRIHAPIIPTRCNFSARMVHEGDRFFGTDAFTSIATYSAPTQMGDQQDPSGAPTGCGCASTRDPSLLFALLALRKRKRR